MKINHIFFNVLTSLSLINLGMTASYANSNLSPSCGFSYINGLASTYDYGHCESGSMCVNNRCEPKCDSLVYGGPDEGLMVHLPLLLNNDPIIGTSETIENTELQSAEWKSITDMSHKSFVIPTSNINNDSNTIKTIAFDFIPNDKNNNIDLISNHAFNIKMIDGNIVVEIFKKWSLGKKIIKTSTVIKEKSKNHLSLMFTDKKATMYLNGKIYAVIFSEYENPKSLVGNIVINSNPIKLWDFRLYNRGLSDEEQQKMAATSKDSRSDTPYKEGYPNFLCGAYVCEWWPLDEDLEENEAPIAIEKYQYYLKKQDEVFERHILDSGMYAHGDICGYMSWSANNVNRNLILSFGIRKTFVKNHSEENPVNQFWLHENFHSFQGNLKRYSGFGGNKYLLESSASWGADVISPGVTDSLLGMYTLVPHIPLWSDQSSPIDDSIYSRFKGGHQYGAYIFKSYLTNYVLNNHLIGDLFNDRRSGSTPVEVINELITATGQDMKTVFTEFAGKVVNFDFANQEKYQHSEQVSCVRMFRNDDGYDPETCIENSPKIAKKYDSNGTGNNWESPDSQYRLGSWSYNTYRVDNPASGEYEFDLRSSNSNPEYSKFSGSIVIKDNNSNHHQYYRLNVLSPGQSSQVKLMIPDNSTIYYVVTSVPDKYKDFDIYSYDFKIFPTV